MADNANVAAIANVAIQLVPEILAMIREHRQAQNPDAPTATDAEVLAALQQAVASSIAKDDKWLAEHPAPPTEPAGGSPF